MTMWTKVKCTMWQVENLSQSAYVTAPIRYTCSQAIWIIQDTDVITTKMFIPNNVIIYHSKYQRYVERKKSFHIKRPPPPLIVCPICIISIWHHYYLTSH